MRVTLVPEVEFDPEPGTIVLLGTALVGMASAGTGSVGRGPSVRYVPSPTVL